MSLATDMIALRRGTVRELFEALELILAAEGNDDALVVTEVGINDGRDVLIGSKAIALRIEYGGRLIISGNQAPKHPPIPTRPERDPGR